MDTKRFHNPEYKRQIKAVRTYRRQVKAAPETNFGKTMQALGLDSFWSKFFVVLGIAALVYLVYFAKFLFVENIQITGANQEAQDSITANFNTFKEEHRFLLPQKNIILFSNKMFTQTLEKQNHHVAKVLSIKKEYWHTVVIEIDQRVPAYLLRSGGNIFVLNSDGVVGGQLTNTVSEDGTQPTLPALPNLIDFSGQSVSAGDVFFNEKQTVFIRYMRENFERQTSNKIVEYQIPSRASEQLNIVSEKGFKVYFTNTLDPETYLQRLRAMLIQLTPEQQSRLSYLDLRFEKNAFGCYKGDACDK